MIKKLRFLGKKKNPRVELHLSFSEFQDLRSYMNIKSKEFDWDIENEAFGNIGNNLLKCLKEEENHG